MDFAVGDKVLFINDTGRGKILEVLTNGKVKVEDENGFDYIMESKLLMKENNSLQKAILQIDEYDLNLARSKEITKKSPFQEQVLHAEPYSKYSPDILEVDLHAEVLTDFPKKLSSGEIVQLQLKVFERMLEKAIVQRKRKLIAIHGVGQGVLRNELRNLLSFYPNVSFQDANYREYGYGATEILIHQK